MLTNPQLGPAIGGTFADPVTAFPNTFSQDGIFGHFPFLLPNLICVGMLLSSIVLGYFLLEETHPDMQPRVMLPDSTYVSEETPLVQTADAIKTPAVDLRADRYGTFEGSDDSQWRHATHKIKAPQIFTKRVVALLIALGVFTYHSMAWDHLFPIFLEDKRAEVLSAMSNTPLFFIPGGLGLSVQQVGAFLSTDGLFALFVQVFLFPFAATRLGTYRLFILVTFLHPIQYILMPYLVYLPLSWLTAGIYTCMAIRNITSIMAYPLLLILLKEATPSPSVLGKINGLSASVGAACRTIAPPVAGYLYTLGSRMDFTGLAWFGSALVAGIGAAQCLSIKRASWHNDIEDCKAERISSSRTSIAESFSDEEGIESSFRTSIDASSDDES